MTIARAGPPSIHALGLAGTGALLLLAASVLPIDAPWLALFSCPFRAATSLPCFGCGFTHAFQFVVRGEFASALASSPLGTLLALAAALHALWTAIRLAGLPYAPAIAPLGAGGRWACALALAANWTYLLLRTAP